MVPSLFHSRAHLLLKLRERKRETTAIVAVSGYFQAKATDFKFASA
jgi:hypothetical protein